MPKKIKSELKENIVSWLWGVAFSFVFLSLLPWLLSYYGYIDLKLPIRFNFEKIEKEVENNLPPNYNYSFTNDINFRGGTKTKLIYANHKDYFDWNNKDDNLPDNKNGVILLLDENDDSYEISYKFQPKTNDNEMNKFGFYVFEPTIMDIDEDGDEEIVVEWNIIGASLWPGYFTILDSEDGEIKMITTESESVDEGSISIYSQIDVENVFGEEKFSTNLSEFNYYNQGTISRVYVADDKCRGCDHLYRVDDYFYDGSSVMETTRTDYFDGFEELKKIYGKITE